MSLGLCLVTGAPGWLGTRLAASLARGLEDASVADARAQQLCTGDLVQLDSLAPFLAGARDATVIHAAGVIHPTRGVREFFAVNVEGTRHLLDASRRAGIRRFVHVSSNSPFGFNPDADHAFDESSDYHPYQGYGRSKHEAELLVKEAGARGDFETVIVRPPWFYGPGQPARQTLFFSLIRRGLVPLLGRGDNRRSMAYIDNLCLGLLLAATHPAAAGQAFWIADPRPYSVAEVIATIEDVLESEAGVAVPRRRVRLPRAIGTVACGLDALVQWVGLYEPRVHVLSEMHRNIVCSVAKAERVLGYRPTVELREGMRRSIRWLLERKVEF
jgi:nucleoside-diphosphate-sugar epimerase